MSVKKERDPHESAPPSLVKGYLFIGIGILFLLGPIVSTLSYFWQDLQNDNDEQQTTNGHPLYEYWRETRPFLRPLTVLPATLIICICHWVSIRIYLRR